MRNKINVRVFLIVICILTVTVVILRGRFHANIVLNILNSLNSSYSRLLATNVQSISEISSKIGGTNRLPDTNVHSVNGVANRSPTNDLFIPSYSGTKKLPDTNAQTVTFTKKHDCKLVEPKLSPTLLPTTGLVSFPGAGNTWTRHLLQQVSGE